MLLNDDEVNQRLEHPDNLVNVIKSDVLVIPRNQNLKKPGDTQVPDRVRDLLGMMRRSSSESGKEIGETFGVSQPTVTAAGKGLIGDRFDPELAEKLDNAEDKNLNDAHGAALDVLMLSLKALRPRLVSDDIKAKDLSRIATDMSRITANIKPKGEIEGPKVQVVLISTRTRSEREYDSIDA